MPCGKNPPALAVGSVKEERDIWKRKFETCYAQMEEEASDYRCIIEKLTRKLADAKREG